LVGKVVKGLEEDSIENPGTIADNVGDNVGDIAGMGADLFGSLAEATCACLVISATSPELIKESGYYFPLLVSGWGIVICFFCSFLSTFFIKANTRERVMLSLNIQLFVTTLLMTPILYMCSKFYLPATFKLQAANKSVTSNQAFICTCLGLWSGYVIGFTTNYYTSGSYKPVQKLAKQCV
jgi:Na+/H+-translocating membrane pyrophosphatase